MANTQIHSSLDLNASRKHQGFLQVPYSYNLAGWANLLIPVTVVANGRGPTALVLAGNHGDEYQGQIAIMKLARELRPEQVTGRIIMIPSLNLPAAKAATRLSPVDGKNMNRAFPGNPNGTVTEMIADYLTTVLFPMSDIVIDIHTGGRSLAFVPCATMHLVKDREQRRKMLDAMLAWNADFAFLYADIAGSGLLPVEAENQGKIVVTTEMGGGEMIPASVHRITQSGLRNVLVHVGVLSGKEETRTSLGLPPPVLLTALDRGDYLLAPESGIYEGLVELGHAVEAGQPVGQLHFLERTDREPVVIRARSAGYLVASRSPAHTGQGDCVACIGHAVELESLR
jgi:predicted deacylase